MNASSARFARGSLHQGDCLTLLPQIGGRPFDLVYLDPPFNTGRARAARLGRGERVNGAAAYDDRWGGIEGFLAMLGPRLSQLPALLSARASVWIHLDYRAVHDAKRVADQVFGARAFIGEVIWVPGNGSRSTRALGVTHQTILVYAPSGSMIWRPDEPILREPYAETSLRMHFGKVDAAGRNYRERTLGGKTYRYYADAGRQLGSVWSDCPAMRANTPLVRETTGYPTQKPEKLLERIVSAASEPDSRVLDPMCGSGTTLAVAQRLGREFVGIDKSPVAFRVARGRLTNTSDKRAPRLSRA